MRLFATIVAVAGLAYGGYAIATDGYRYFRHLLGGDLYAQAATLALIGAVTVLTINLLRRI